MSDRYRWESPQDWLAEVAREWDTAKLYGELMTLAALLDCDALQDEYQREMDADGYFEKLENV